MDFQNVRLLIVFIVLLTLTSCDKEMQDNIENDLIRWNLKGSVKSISEIRYSESGKYATNIVFNKIGFVTEQASYNPDKSLIRKWIFRYGKNNRKDTLYCYVLNDILSYTSAYTYDNLGNVISIEMNKPDRTQSTESVMLYDDKNRKIKETLYDANKTIVHEIEFKYSNDLRTEEIHNDAAMNRKWKQMIYYNQNGEKEKTVSLSMEDSILSKMVYAYNSEGKVTENSLFESDSSLVSKTYFTYTETGEEKERQKILLNGNLDEEQKREYKYDKSLNWVFMAVNLNGNGGEIVTRDIQYFE